MLLRQKLCLTNNTAVIDISSIKSQTAKIHGQKLDFFHFRGYISAIKWTQILDSVMKRLQGFFCVHVACGWLGSVLDDSNVPVIDVGCLSAISIVGEHESVKVAAEIV